MTRVDAEIRRFSAAKRAIAFALRKPLRSAGTQRPISPSDSSAVSTPMNTGWWTM